MTHWDELDLTADLRPACRFAGMSLDYRASEPGWPAPFRCRILPNAPTRQHYRITTYGDTPATAIAAATEEIARGEAETHRLLAAIGRAVITLGGG